MSLLLLSESQNFRPVISAEILCLRFGEHGLLIFQPIEQNPSGIVQFKGGSSVALHRLKTKAKSQEITNLPVSLQTRAAYQICVICQSVGPSAS